MAEEEMIEDTRLGRYLLVQKLGHGGMGEVYRALAYGAAGVVKTVCIKRILAEKADKYWRVESFIEEARLSMQLSHTNIVSVFDFGVAEGGYYLAMEWIDGVDLMSFVRRKMRLPPAVVAYIGAETCRALARAHQGTEEGGAIIHRDVKPSNILISRRGEVKLADFGIAVLQGGQRSVAGTPGYMSPEQENGALVDGRADIYGLGVSLLEIAIGGRAKKIEESLGRVEDEALRIALGAMLEPDPLLRAPTAEIVGKRFERMVATALAAGEDHPRDLLAADVAKVAKKVPPRRRVKRELMGTESLLLAPSEIRETPAAKTAEMKTEITGTPRVLPLTRGVRRAGEVEPHAGEGKPRSEQSGALASPEEGAGRDAVAFGIRGRWAMSLFGLGFTLTLALIFLYRGLEREAGLERELMGQGYATGSGGGRDDGRRAGSGPHPFIERYLTPLGPPIDVRHVEEARSGPIAGVSSTHPASEGGSETAGAPGAPGLSGDEESRTMRERRASSSSARSRHHEKSRVSSSARASKDAAKSSSSSAARASASRSPGVSTSTSRAMGTLNISVRPWAHVRVNGVRKGETPIVGLSLPAGEHELILENPELAVTRVVRVQIVAGESVTYRADLR